MLSVSPVRSSSGAAEYFSKDNYYTEDHSAALSEWGGKGAEAFGLSGKVDKDSFQNLLNGRLPDGTSVNNNPNRRTGLDLPLSMPKSASVLAYVTGDKRILEAHRDAVKQAMGYAEKNFAEGRGGGAHGKPRLCNARARHEQEVSPARPHSCRHRCHDQYGWKMESSVEWRAV